MSPGRRALARGLGAAVVGVLLVGCSQVDALVPVSGGPESIVRNATIEVLLRDELDVLVAPSCAADAARTAITCTGRSGDDQAIETTAAPKAPYEMTVTVGGREIYQGSAQAAIDAAAQS
jgi:hypothetical protein